MKVTGSLNHSGLFTVVAAQVNAGLHSFPAPQWFGAMTTGVPPQHHIFGGPPVFHQPMYQQQQFLSQVAGQSTAGHPFLPHDNSGQVTGQPIYMQRSEPTVKPRAAPSADSFVPLQVSEPCHKSISLGTMSQVHLSLWTMSQVYLSLGNMSQVHLSLWTMSQV